MKWKFLPKSEFQSEEVRRDFNYEANGNERFKVLIHQVSSTITTDCSLGEQLLFSTLILYVLKINSPGNSINSLRKIVDFSKHLFKGKFISYTCFAYRQSFISTTL